jgi:hypothetical protein
MDRSAIKEFAMLAMTKMKCGVLAGLMALAAVAGCQQSGNSDPQDGDGDSNSTAALPEGFLLASMPENVQGVAEAKDKLKEGDDVAIRGRIGGANEPFVAGRAAFTIVDAGLKACSDIPGDECQRPWDYCCEPRDSLARHSATISVVNAEGKPLPMSMHGVHGLQELSDVVIVGKVAQAEGNVLLVHAEGIYVVRQ